MTPIRYKHEKVYPVKPGFGRWWNTHAKPIAGFYELRVTSQRKSVEIIEAILSTGSQVLVSEDPEGILLSIPKYEKDRFPIMEESDSPLLVDTGNNIYSFTFSLTIPDNHENIDPQDMEETDGATS